MNSDLLNMRICGCSIGDAELLTSTELMTWCQAVHDEYKNSVYAHQINPLLYEVERRVQHLIDLNLEYISIGRSIPTLSGGELQRVRLATQLDCSLTGLVYIFDEPCKGLHYKNVSSIIDTTRHLVDKGNTVIAIEHNAQYIATADHIVEMGPDGGPAGGYIVSEHPGEHGFRYSVVFKEPRVCHRYLEINNITYRNLKSVSIRLPVGCVTCISGVSGSGKSSLSDIIEEVVERGESEHCLSVGGDFSMRRVMRVNQQPIGKTARSTVISYLDIYSAIRDVFARTSEAKRRGLSASDFSMNVPGGRCECCLGTGKQKIELSYMPESYVICPQCNGSRFHDEILTVTYKGLTINDVLDSNIYTLIKVFENLESVRSVLSCMIDIGMGYVSLGQMSMNLSGGEAQRIKLAKHLGINSKGGHLYILDEPTSGLSQKDIDRLVAVIDQLVNHGDSVVIIEHNIEFIARVADYLIDLGSVAGDAGGRTVIQGDPRSVMQANGSSWKELLSASIVLVEPGSVPNSV